MKCPNCDKSKIVFKMFGRKCIDCDKKICGPCSSKMINSVTDEEYWKGIEKHQRTGESIFDMCNVCRTLQLIK